jgi:hypothetical protein
MVPRVDVKNATRFSLNPIELFPLRDHGHPRTAWFLAGATGSDEVVARNERSDDGL